ncbi:MAG: hypothetical protein ACI9C4_002176 [Paraglaciecola sp.]
MSQGVFLSTCFEYLITLFFQTLVCSNSPVKVIAKDNRESIYPSPFSANKRSLLWHG